MGVHAIIENGIVVNIAVANHPLAENWIETETAAIGDLYADGVFTKPPEPEPDWPALIAERRYQAEISGITLNGISIDTDRDSQALLTGAALQALLDPGYSLRWKTPAGFVDLTAQQLTDIATAVRAHVQACFDREAALLEEMANGKITRDMIEEGWPG